jgi:hypothetical protein
MVAVPALISKENARLPKKALAVLLLTIAGLSMNHGKSVFVSELRVIF